MNTKGFVVLLFGILVIGSGIGGAFVAFKEFRSSNDEAGTQNILQPRSLAAAEQENMSQLRERVQSGEVSQEEWSTLREQILDQLDQNPGRLDLGAGGFGRLGGLTGDIEKIDGNTITVNTPQGMLQADVLPDSDIRILTEGTVENLQPDIMVRVRGQRGEDGIVDAIVISITPEESGGFRSAELTEEHQVREGMRGQFGQDHGAGGSGGLTEEQLNQFREGMRGQFGQGQGTGAFAGLGGLTGKIEKIEGDIITLNTSQGQRQARLGDDTTIQMFVEDTLAGLQIGMRVTVLGQRVEGKVEAQSINVIPESTDGLFGNRQE